MRLVGLLLCLLGSARASEDALVRQEYESGLRHYEAGRYEEALGAFERGRRIRPLPAFDFNIARCYDRLERWNEAVVAYRAYVAHETDRSQVIDAESRLEAIEARIKTERAKAEASRASPKPVLLSAPPPPTPTPLRRRWWIWTAGGIAVAGISVGLAVGLTRPSDRFNSTLPDVGLR